MKPTWINNELDRLATSRDISWRTECGEDPTTGRDNAEAGDAAHEGVVVPV